MPPKKATAKKLHELAVEVSAKTIIVDSSKKKQYSVGKQFATGGFGRIYTCSEVGSNKELVVKIEPSGNGPLFTEVNVFQRILKFELIEDYKKQNKLKWIGLPWVISAGVFDYKTEKLRYMIIPKYETSLEAIREKSAGGSFDSKTVWIVSRSILTSLQYIHSKSYTHADVKAANILLEKASDVSTAVLVDFGLARLAANNEDKPDKKRAHNGTAIFTSQDAHRGCHPSYRGDIEILAYNIIYWLTGKLPWLDLEQNADKVYGAKQEFMNKIGPSLASALKDHMSSIKPLTTMFNIVTQTKYKDQVNFDLLFKVVESIIADLSSRKRGSADNGTPSVDVKRATMTEKPRTPKSKREVSKAQVLPNQAKIVSGTTVRTKVPLALKSSKMNDIPTVQLSDEETGMDQQNKGDSSAARASRLNARRAQSGSKLNIVPGLSNTNKVVSKAIADTGTGIATPRVKLTAGPTEKVKSATKKSPRQLRQLVPGVRNFPQARRSLAILQITKKYRKLASKKNDEGAEK